MKKLIILALIFTSSSFIGAQQNLSSNDVQKTHLNDSLETSDVSFYTSFGLSIGNQGGDSFNNTSYLSIENGIMYKDFFGGIVIGNGNLKLDKGDFYFWEAKVGCTFPIGILNGSAFFGAGSYFTEKYFTVEGEKTHGVFIEGGAGISYTYKKLSFGVCYSRWDGLDYITPAITINW
jgi:hypothetical protein